MQNVEGQGHVRLNMDVETSGGIILDPTGRVAYLVISSIIRYVSGYADFER